MNKLTPIQIEAGLCREEVDSLNSILGFIEYETDTTFGSVKSVRSYILDVIDKLSDKIKELDIKVISDGYGK